MNVRVEVGPLVAGATLVESKTVVEFVSNVVIIAPTVSHFSLTSVISLGSSSISAVQPESFRIGVRAA
jgi:hypothetical protein